MPTISVIVPVYKVENFLHRCVDSILSQTYTDFELILVDDGSPDKCPAICDDYAAKDGRVVVIHQTNQGLAAVRNNGVKSASGKWICFVDSDDMIHPQMLEILFTAVNRTGANLSVCGVCESEHVPQTFMNPCDTSFYALDISEPTIMDLLNAGKHRYWIACAKLVEKSILIQYPFMPGRIFEDNAVVYKWIHSAGRIANCNADLYYYAVNPAGITQSSFNIKRLDFLWAMEEQMAFYHHLGYEKMLSRICTGYVLSAADFYTKVRKELRDKANARIIRRKIKTAYNEFPQYIKLSSEQKEYVTSQLCPRISAIRRYIFAFTAEFAKGGIKGVWQKIARKLTNR